MSTRGKYLRYLCVCTHSTYRHAASDGLRHGYHIRLNTVCHICHDLSGSSPSGLNLVKHKKYLLLITELSESLQEFRICRIYSALSLHRLHHDSYGVLITLTLEIFKVIIFCICKSRKQRCKSLMTCRIRLSCCRQCTVCSSMEAVLCSNDLVMLRSVMIYSILSCHLDHGLICLCS